MGWEGGSRGGGSGGEEKRVGRAGQLCGGLLNLSQEKLGATAGTLRGGVGTASVDL